MTVSVSYYYSLLQSSISLSHIRQLHAHVLQTVFYNNVRLTSTLMLAYSHHRKLEPDALSVFDSMPYKNTYTWNIIIGEYSRWRLYSKSLELFILMWKTCPQGVRPDEFCLPHVLRACLATHPVVFGASMHGLCIKLGFSGSVYVGSALVYMYVNMARAVTAKKVFDEMPKRDAILWTSILAGYAQHEEPESGLIFFREMVSYNVKLDWVVMVSLLSICEQMALLKEGKSIHSWCVKHCSGQMDLNLGNSMINFYSKCASLSYARILFDKLGRKDVISCSALMQGYGLIGNVSEALRLYKSMIEGGIRPNKITFLGLLSACAHVGMVDEARIFFRTMKRDFGLEPGMRHFAIMVSCLAKTGHVEEAEKLVETMPMEPDSAVLGALLMGCKDHDRVGAGERVAMKLISVEPDKADYYVILSNMYAQEGRFCEAQRIREMMNFRNVSKIPGYSFLRN